MTILKVTVRKLNVPKETWHDLLQRYIFKVYSLSLSCMYSKLMISENAGNGAILTIFWVRWVGTLFSLETNASIWLTLVSKSFSKSGTNSLLQFVFHFLDLLHVYFSSCCCTKFGMFYHEKESWYCQLFQWILFERWAKFHFVRFHRFQTYRFNIFKTSMCEF